jgi:RNase H-like domain found in reverse transcriptase/Reverse transcriptase (RNA-dependent DNA polymerase)
MPFGLTNAPGGFQRFLSGIFSDLLDVYVIIYLDDILIFSGNKDDHFRHVSKVLKWLCKHGLYANGKKCDFHSESVDYLGHMIGPIGLQMNPAKVKVIQDWPEPRKVKDIQSFLGFANFYKQYIHNYSDIVVPLTHLTQKNIPWNFNESCKLAFLTLKQAFISALVLTHYKPGCPLVIKTNASDYALAAILSQVESNGEIHLVTYLSWTFSDTKLNYDTHDKELMAIYEAFKAWQHYLEGIKVPIDVITNHKNLEYFCTIWILSRRQTQWSTFLSRFIWLSDSVLAASEQNPMHLLVGLTFTQKERESLMVQSIHKIVVLFFLLLNYLLLSKSLLVALRGIFTMDIEEL